MTLATVAEARSADNQIEALSFRNGVMDLRVVAPGVPELDEFARNVSSGGQFQAVIQGTSTSDTGIEGRLQVVAVPQ